MTNQDEVNFDKFLEQSLFAKARIEGIERELQTWADKPIHFEFDPSGTHLYSMEELVRAFARRAIDLSKAIWSLLEDDQILPATVIGRALVETVGMACLFIHDMDRLIVAGDLDRFNKQLTRFYAGIKGKEIEPIHVMDAIRHLEKVDANYVRYLDEKYSLISIAIDMVKSFGHELSSEQFMEKTSIIKNYSDLSEVSHPNGTGTQLIYGASDVPGLNVDKLRSKFRHNAMMAIWQCHHMIAAFEENSDLTAKFQAKFLQSEH